MLVYLLNELYVESWVNYSKELLLHIALASSYINGFTFLCHQCISLAMQYLRSTSLQCTHEYLYFNDLAFNPDKSEANMFSSHPNHCTLSLPIPVLTFLSLSFCYKRLSKHFGATMDGILTFQSHLKNVCKSCFCHIRVVHWIRSALSKQISQTIGVCSLVCFCRSSSSSLVFCR